MKRTTTRLSDGRELIYFDHDHRAARVAVDARGLSAGSTEQATMRLDALTGEWVAIAGHRQARIFLPSAAECPLCPTRDGNLSEIPESQYDVAVFENRFPSFLGTGGGGDLPAELGGSVPAHGRCEVVAYSDSHVGSIGDLDAGHMALVLEAWIDRTRELGGLPGVRSVFVFENRGGDVGVTLHHPHGQIYAYPYVPPGLRVVLDQARGYRASTGRALLEDVVAFERDSRVRVIHSDEHWIAFVPYAARWPYEVQIHPVAGRGSLTELDDAEKESFSHFYPALIRALDRIFGMPFPYMSGWYQRPAHATPDEEREGRTYLRLISNRRAADKLKYLAGSEALMGAFINDVAPEAAALQIRDLLRDS